MKSALPCSLPLIAVLCLLLSVTATNQDYFYDGVYYRHKKMPQLVRPFGYSLEEHFVETGDGYVLGLYRIPFRRQAPPVLLLHGLLDSSATWVLNYPSQSLGFILADAGYDVWMSNSRGNAFSRNHTGFPPDSSEFWDFSFDDMADYDVPAVLDYILRTTKYSNVAVIAHSQGSTQMFAFLSESGKHANLSRHISVFVALGPAVFVHYVTSIPLILLAEMQADQIFDMMGQHEFLPARKATADIFEAVCQRQPSACASIITAICGFNENNINMTRLPLYVEYAPSGTSVKNMAHWAQLVRGKSGYQSPTFARYDYGQNCFKATGHPRNCNQRVYGSTTPPAFNVSSITGIPIAIFSGAQDRLADIIDVNDLVHALISGGSLVHFQTEMSFEHIDFTWGLSSATKIYPAILKLLKEHHRMSNRANILL